MDDLYSRFKKPPTQRPEPKRVPVSRPQYTVPKPPIQKASAQPEPITLQSAKTEPVRTPKRKPRKKVLLLIAAVMIVSGTAGAWYFFKHSPTQNIAQPPPTYPLFGPIKPADKSIRLVATGDMIAHESINKNAQKTDGSYDYAALMDKMKPYFEKADVRFCNQATPAGGEQFGISGYPSFNAPVEFARGIEQVGCNLINIGTNHTNDKGQPLIDASVATWDNRKNILAVAGANRSLEEQKSPRTFTVSGMKFAFLSYSTYTNKPATNGFGVNMYDEATAKTEIASAQETSDFVIVSMRWGTEYSPDINVHQDQVSQILADAGADAIFGHGPHTIQPVKRIKTADNREVLVWFSLGNFLNSQIDIETLIGGFAIMDIDTETKKITGLKFMPVYQHYEWTGQQATRRNAADLAARHSFQMIPLDKAEDLLAKSHHNTTVEAQTERLKQLLNKYTEVPVITSTQY